MEIKAPGGEAAKNKQLADMLTGFKALGAGAAAKNPDVGELLNRIEVSSGADFVKIAAGLPEDLLQKAHEVGRAEGRGHDEAQGGTAARSRPRNRSEEPAEEPED